MKKFYSGILIANLVIELVGVSALLAAPDFLVDSSNESALLWSWNYASVALAMGGTVFWAWPYRESYAAAGAVLGIIASFHLALALALFIAEALFIDVVLHSIFGAICLYLYTQRVNWCDRP
jgi:hypothetical protein